MAWISLGKLVLLSTGLVYLTSRLMRRRQDAVLYALWSVRVTLAVVMAFGLSLIGSDAPLDVALLAFAKHSKLLEIAVLIALVRTWREAQWAVAVFLVSQAIFIATSWAMAAGVPIPWASSRHATIEVYRYVVFSTYLDQTLIFSSSAAIFWHLRAYWPAWRWAAVLMALAAVGNTLFLQEGRTGYVAASTVLTLAIMWELPKKARWAALTLAPVFLMAGLYAGSTQVQGRMAQALTEALHYQDAASYQSSAGFRLHAWQRSLQAIAERPLTGHGVGSWTLTVKRLEGANGDKIFGHNLGSNPHQEYLMWAVELGVGGLLLLVLLVAALIRDAMTFDEPIKRAAITVITVMAVACLFNASLYDALIGDFFCITLGLLLAMGARQKITSDPFDPHQPTGANP